MPWHCRAGPRPREPRESLREQPHRHWAPQHWPLENHRLHLGRRRWGARQEMPPAVRLPVARPENLPGHLASDPLPLRETPPAARHQVPHRGNRRGHWESAPPHHRETHPVVPPEALSPESLPDHSASGPLHRRETLPAVLPPVPRRETRLAVPPGGPSRESLPALELQRRPQPLRRAERHWGESPRHSAPARSSPVPQSQDLHRR
jgi:hypothetical protein